MSLGLGGYTWYLSNKIKMTKLKTAQLVRDLQGWEISYNSLDEEYAKTQAVSLALRKNLKRLRQIARKRETKFEALKNDVKIKSWATTVIPGDVIKFMQRSKKSTTPESDKNKTTNGAT